MAIKSEAGGYLIAEGILSKNLNVILFVFHTIDDGKFVLREHRQHSKWHIEHVRDGFVSIKAHNTSWFIGVSMFGNPEPINSESSERAHWRFELNTDGY